jgi:hypothetical protein
VARRNTASAVADRGGKRRSKAIAMMIAEFKMAEVSTMTMCTTKDRAEEEYSANCLAAAAVAASSHPLP